MRPISKSGSDATDHASPSTQSGASDSTICTPALSLTVNPIADYDPSPPQADAVSARPNQAETAKGRGVRTDRAFFIGSQSLRTR